MERRDFLKTLGAASASLLVGKSALAKDAKPNEEFVGVLFDATRCIGCRTCEMACAEAHNLPLPDTDNEKIFETERKMSAHQWTVVNRYDTDVGQVFVKKQCMHCDEPACASGCLTKAMFKTKQGPVIWRSEKCMGCRFCMINCPFDVPKFEYDSPNPKIQKCIMCYERLQQGEIPACVQACPGGALIFDTRRNLLEIARKRIYDNHDKYVDHIYGENEAGGSGWLYLSPVPFEQLGFRTDIGTTPYPEYSKGFLYSVPIILTLWPGILLAISNATKANKEDIERGAKYE
ncbi:MAG: twin-arginine translocation signal domain-containing protein [Calditrichaeota bacterium]|nr:twin-arginine translocation signal domain-containing protein [Calditrichota bacterium]